MIYISHRGNIDGKKPHLENHPDYIEEALNLGYDVEIDLWYVDDKFMLGHDEPQYEIEWDSWINYKTHKLWIHCKNIEAMVWLDENTKDVNYFWHEEDTATLTSFGYIWAYPGKQPIRGSIAVMPERSNDDISQCKGICSDIIKKYKDEITQA
jgi:hypothetical protein